MGEELRVYRGKNLDLEDALNRNQTEFEDYRNQESVRQQNMMHELEQLRELKQINMREIDSLRAEVGEGRRANTDLKQQIDLKLGDVSQR